MKKPLFALLAVVFTTGASLASAENIALVDTQSVLNQCIIGKVARSNVEARVKAAQAKLAQGKSDFEKQRADLEKQAKVLSGSALESRKEALAKKQIELQRALQDTQEELARVNDQEVTKVVTQIQEVVKELAKERKYTFVFEKDRQTVLYASGRIDISADVVKILDKKKVAL